MFQNLAVAMDGERGSGAALRRRERRLRAWQRHVRTAVQLALAVKLHHSANKVEPHDALRGQNKRAGREEVEHATHYGPRAQKTPPPAERPGILAEPGLQRSDRTVRRSSGDGLPQLVTPSLASTASEAVDSATLAFLLSQSLAAKKHEEQKQREEEARKVLAEWRRRRRKLNDEFMALLNLSSRSPLQQKRMEELADLADEMEASRPGTSSASSSALKKKTKKRRKRMRTSSFPGTTSWCLVVG